MSDVLIRCQAQILAEHLLSESSMNLKVPIRLRLADGNEVDGMFHGYWDFRDFGQGVKPAISYPLANGAMTTGFLPAGAQILGDIMSFEDWQALEQQQQQPATAT